jgi:hypothetical protein
MKSYKFDGFSLKNTFESHKEFNEFLKSRITFATLKSSLINCSICKSRNHKMRYKIGRCNDVNCNKDFQCELQVKILTCQKREKVAYFTKETHNASVELRRPNRHGISPSVKEKLEDLIFNYDSRPKRLHIKLNKLKRNKKFEFDYMPTLKQIQSFINNRRQKIGDENNLDDLKTFCAGLKYSEGITKEDELYTFGEHYGDGSDTEHFQLGLTSKKMMAKVELNGMFHIDATYKIVKYNYPLIILGTNLIFNNNYI